MRTNVSVSIAMAGIVCVACAGPPRIADSSYQACTTSLAAVGRAARHSNDSTAFTREFLQFAGIAMKVSLGDAFSLGGGGRDVSVERPPTDSTFLFQAMCDALEGLTATDIARGGDSLGLRVAASLQRRRDSAYVKALDDARLAAAAIRDSLSGFQVTAARLSQQQGYFDLEAEIDLTVHNGTGHAISRAYFHGRSVTPGRQVPWLEDDFNYQIPGGLEPGETATWALKPNQFVGPWTSVRVPSSARFEVSVVKLDGPDGQPLWGGATFTDGDQRMLDSLRGVLGGAPSGK